MDIADFLPSYPSFDDDFYTDLFLKKEFNELQLPVVEDISSLEGDYFKHQKIIARFVSVYTPYVGLLVVHRMGTGKTKAAIAASELVRSSNSTITGAVVCARGDSLLENFRAELVNSNLSHYVPENVELLTEGERITRQRVLLKSWYYYSQRNRTAYFGATFYELAKQLTSMSDEEIIEQFSNKIYIVDEVHNIRPRETSSDDGESIQVYKQFHRLFHTARNIKVLLLTGTPIKDTLDEFANVMNLILPSEDQFIRKQFLATYFEKEADTPYLSLKASMVQDLKKKLKGRVTYLRSMDSNVKITFRGEKNFGGLRHLIVYPVEMSSFQTKHYAPLYKADSSGSGTVYLDSRQASAFVFPDGSQGDEGFKRWVVKTTSQRSIGGVSDSWYKLSSAFEKELEGPEEDPFYKLRKFGAVYATTIQMVAANAKAGKLQFVYGEYVTGSGAILFSLLLEKFGKFVRATKQNVDTPSTTPRYALINNMASSGAESRKLRIAFNNPNNLFGQHLNTIIGSTVTAEGFSLLNVQAEYILTPHWNYTETDQAIARGNRVGSHNRLIEAGISPVLDVYQFVAIPDPEYKVKSVDLEMYLVSEVKDVNVKKLERVIKEAAFDCALDYKRNRSYHASNFSRDCDYLECDYDCDDIPSDLYKAPSYSSLCQKLNKRFEVGVWTVSDLQADVGIGSAELWLNGASRVWSLAHPDNYEDVIKELSIYGIDTALTTTNLRTPELYSQDVLVLSQPYAASHILPYIPDTALVALRLDNRWKLHRGNIAAYVAQKSQRIDYTNFNLFYSGKEVDITETKVKEVFRNDKSATLAQLETAIPEASKYVLLSAVKRLIDTAAELRDRYDQPCFLKEENDNFFLVSSLSETNSPLSSFYIKHPILYFKENYARLLLDLRIQLSQSTILSIFQISNAKTIKNLLIKLPVYVQSVILESCLLAKREGTTQGEVQREIILKVYKNSYSTLSDGTLVTSLSGIKCLSPSSHEWKVCDSETQALYDASMKTARSEATQQYEGYYGTYNDLTDSFCIVRPQEGQQNALTVKTGQICTTWKKRELIPICVKIFGLKAPDPSEPNSVVPDNSRHWADIRGLNKDQLIEALLKDNKQTKPFLTREEMQTMSLEMLQSAQYWRVQSLKVLCTHLQKWMESHDLVLPSQNCGTSLKKKRSLV